MKHDTITETTANSSPVADTSVAAGAASPANLPAAAQPPVIPMSGLGGGAFEGAERMSRQMANWTARDRSADADLFPAKTITDARAKDISRNDSYIENGITKRKDSVVGARFQLNAAPNVEYLMRKDKRLDETWAEEFQDEVESMWELAAESGSCWMDAQRKKTATEIIRLGIGSTLIHGELLMSSEWIRRRRRPFKTAFKMIDPSRLDDPMSRRDSHAERENIRRGVRINMHGEPVGYYIANEHPHDYYKSYRSLTTGKNYQYTPAETPWGRRNILHLFEEKRVDQSRGISSMVSALSEMKMTKSFREIMLQNAITNATYAAAIESELPTEAILEMLGGDDPNPEAYEKAVAGYSGGFLSSLQAYMGNTNGTLLNGVKIPHLFPGTKLNLLPASSGGPLGTEFEKSLMRYLAANFNMSYEQFTGDMSSVNYSTLKGAINETEKHVKVEKRMTADRIANFMYCNWLEEQIVNGTISCMPKGIPIFWEDLNREAYSQAEWTNSGRGQIEELKESQAASLRLKSSVSTLEDETARFGKDWKRVLKQRARENDYAAALGLDITINDNSLNAASGTPKDKSGTDIPETNSDSKKRKDNAK